MTRDDNFGLYFFLSVVFILLFISIRQVYDNTQEIKENINKIINVEVVSDENN